MKTALHFFSKEPIPHPSSYFCGLSVWSPPHHSIRCSLTSSGISGTPDSLEAISSVLEGLLKCKVYPWDGEGHAFSVTAFETLDPAMPGVA